ncbi:SDR family NAD(P)-dependent oxidoreductase [Mycobacteroides chelonae]|uniref:Short-chain dehydrogenase/reductase n=1 Tax=Mycobacteroides chelonae TaxID=1774 RepID=A0A1S1M7G3_MYCCH|nr:SDR family NAD(P)-dependent oxidoreductase [Mycobacteroides chelonae]OHU53774.1 short-chain dehydrogenase/reductase [Mycobacteroides chelonae]OHU80559.1 short-chain dehydrogenase/reductase [Mycobacteroides chelonae]QQG86611.1 SDR family NAD(P)-dependent oxidoreductase [Mycobacteroides chelonae]QQG91428.1 SDR family NAD(P)-dependent oxidoreductase [Mycobacteroides chelonae]
MAEQLSKTWFITGASRGLGRAWATAALERGDRVALAVREAEAVVDLVGRFGDAALPVTLDVTDRQAALAGITLAHKVFGRLDVVVNNAGFVLTGAAEELSEDDVRAQFETNTFGVIWVVQAALPVLRAQGAGHILNVSSLSGVSAFANSSLYSASKWAVEGFSQALRLDVKHLGIRVTVIEPGPYDTELYSSMRKPASTIPDYQSARERAQSGSGELHQGGNITASAQAILAVVDAPDPPLRILLGGHRAFVAADYESRLAEWNEWEDVSAAAG